MQAEKVERKEGASGNEPEQLEPLRFRIGDKRWRLAAREREQQECWRCERHAVERRCGRLKLAQSHQDRRGAERDRAPQKGGQRNHGQAGIRTRRWHDHLRWARAYSAAIERGIDAFAASLPPDVTCYSFVESKSGPVRSQS